MREKETRYPTEQRQENVLRKQLPGDTPTPGAKRTAQQEFSFARYSAGQLQVGHIRATNQQKECDTGHQREQRPVHSTFHIAQHILTERNGFHCPAAAEIGILLLELTRDGL